MRTTTIGCTTGASGATPGMRRPVRTMTVPPTPSRRIRLGLPTSPVVSGVIVAALSPRPAERIAAAASCTTPFAVRRRFSRDRSNRRSCRSTPNTSGAKHAQRLLEQLLAGLVAVAHDDLPGPGHTVQGGTKPRRPPDRSRRRSTRSLWRSGSTEGQLQPPRVAGMPLRPSAPGTTPRTWCTEIPPSSNPLADAAM